jgi:hypothetical protein
MTQEEENTAVYAIVQLSIHDVDRYFKDAFKRLLFDQDEVSEAEQPLMSGLN